MLILTKENSCDVLLKQSVNDNCQTVRKPETKYSGEEGGGELW